MATDDGSDVVTSRRTEVPRFARCSVFKDRYAPARRDSPGKHVPPRRRPASIEAAESWSVLGHRLVTRGIDDPHETALSDLEHPPGELLER